MLLFLIQFIAQADDLINFDFLKTELLPCSTFTKLFSYVVRNVVRKSLIFQKESSYPLYTVRFFSNVNYSLSVFFCIQVLPITAKIAEIY